MIKEKEANEFFCPMARIHFAGDFIISTNGSKVINITGDFDPAELTRCKGVICALWRAEHDPDIGWCGLGGKPL